MLSELLWVGVHRLSTVSLEYLMGQKHGLVAHGLTLGTPKVQIKFGQAVLLAEFDGLQDVEVCRQLRIAGWRSVGKVRVVTFPVNIV